MFDFDFEDFLLGYLIGSDREDEVPDESESFDPFYEPAPGGDVNSTVGRYEIPFRTERNGTTYRYVRAYCVVAGTIATGINYSAHLGK